MASLSRSPVRMRTALSIADTKILPSPMRPVRAAVAIASTTRSTWQEIDDIFGATIQFRVALLAAKALGFGHGDSRHADFVKRLLYLVELERLDDGFYFFHLAPQVCGLHLGNYQARAVPIDWYHDSKSSVA
jgi:hypothetical protein